MLNLMIFLQVAVAHDLRYSPKTFRNMAYLITILSRTLDR